MFTLSFSELNLAAAAIVFLYLPFFLSACFIIVLYPYLYLYSFLMYSLSSLLFYVPWQLCLSPMA